MGSTAECQRSFRLMVRLLNWWANVPCSNYPRHTGLESLNPAQVRIETMQESGRWDSYTGDQHHNVSSTCIPNISYGLQPRSTPCAQADVPGSSPTNPEPGLPHPILDDLIRHHENNMGIEFGVSEGVEVTNTSVDWFQPGLLDDMAVEYCQTSFQPSFPLSGPSTAWPDQTLGTGPSNLSLGSSHVLGDISRIGTQKSQASQVISVIESSNSWALAMATPERVPAFENGSFPSRSSQWLQNLPFRQFERQLEREGRHCLNNIPRCCVLVNFAMARN